MRILGIDPGIAECGWAIVSLSGPRPHCYSSGTWHTDVDPDWRARIGGITKLAGGIMRDVDLVSIEAYTYQGERSYAANLIRIPRLIESLCGLARLRKIPCLEVTTTQAKSALGLRGKCDKNRVRLALHGMLDGEWPATTHARDAVAAAVAGGRVWRVKMLGEIQEARG